MEKIEPWTFKGAVAKKFTQHVTNSVPLYGEFHENILGMLPYFVVEGGLIYDVGCSNGRLLSMIDKELPREEFNMIGIEKEGDMVDTIVESSFSHETHIYHEDVRYSELQDSDAVICCLTLQFLNPSDRLPVLRKVNDSLKIGGALFLVEKVKHDDLDIHDMFNDLYYDFKRKSFNVEDILNKNAGLRGVMKPQTTSVVQSELERAGFETHEVFMKVGNFIGIIAIKK